MKINEKKYLWSGNLSKRTRTDYIILHHAAISSASADTIHTAHLKNGWAGIGYHFYVRKDGSIYSARPIDTVGAHTTNYNSKSVGICFEGNFETETMNELQITAGNELVNYLKTLYPKAEVKRHKDFNATACPGRNFPFVKITKATEELTEANAIVDKLNKRGIITDVALWHQKCKNDANSYWLARKLCNMTVNSQKRSNELKTENDIVWELNHRGIILNMPLWLKLLKEDKNLYWLAYKGANLTTNK